MPLATRARMTGLALVVALVAVGVGVRWNTFAAGGSDSHCYLQQAQLFAHGRVVLREPLAIDAPWPAAALTFAPAGFVPSSREAGASVPICPPGLSLIMALVLPVSGAFLVVPAFGGLAVWLTFVLGRRLISPTAGFASALLLACSPIFLYQVVQPMSDVPATALWLAALLWASHEGVRSRLLGGGAAGLALLIRPNLAPLAVIVGVALLVDLKNAAWPGVSGFNTAVRRLAPFAVGLAPGIAALLGWQFAVYGSPLRTGYGDPSALFAWTHVVPNLRRYLGSLAETHGPLLALSLLSPIALPAAQVSRSHADRSRRLMWLCLGVAITTVTVYLPYLEFEEWWYIRFLLPALPPLIVLSVAVLWRTSERLLAGKASIGVLLVAVVVGAWWIGVAVDRRAFRLQAFERHFIDAGHASTRLPAGAVVVTVLDSGSVRFHGQRTTLLWDSLEPDRFEAVLGYLRQRGRHPYLLLEATEVERFRSRFRAHTGLAELDWPPAVQVGSSIRLYDPFDRRRFHADGRVLTQHLWSPVAPAVGRNGGTD